MWDFGDGTGTSTLATPSYTYSMRGNYNACLTVIDSNGCSSTQNCTALEVIAPPVSPILIYPGSGQTFPASTTTIEIQWNAVTDADGYDYIVYSGSCGSTVFASGTSSNLFASISGLQPNQIYTWQVRAFSDCGSSEYSDCFSFTLQDNVRPPINPGGGFPRGISPLY